jgi:hypothetical protein
MKKFAKQGILNPLDGLERIKNKELKHTGVNSFFLLFF